MSAAAILIAERKSYSLVRAAEPLLHFNTALVELSIFQGFNKMELASHTSLDGSSQFAAMPVMVQTGILRSPGRGAVNTQDLRWHSSE